MKATVQNEKGNKGRILTKERVWEYNEKKEKRNQ